MKKLLLGLGTIAAITAPVVSVVACSSQGTVEVTLNSNMTKEQYTKALKPLFDIMGKLDETDASPNSLPVVKLTFDDETITVDYAKLYNSALSKDKQDEFMAIANKVNTFANKIGAHVLFK